jgi:hypothetical protein
MRYPLLLGLAGSLLVTLAVLAGGFDVTHGQSQIDNVSVDMDHSGNDATTADATPETCARIEEDGVQNYDEDDVDIVFIDVIVGPVGIPSDRPISGIGFDLAFPDTAVQVVDVVAVDHDFLLGAGGSPMYIPFDESKPDTTSPYTEAVSDFGGNYESGPGVLIRVGLESVTTDAGGGTVEVLDNNNYLILDDYSEIIPATNFNSATVAVNQPCTTDNDPPVCAGATVTTDEDTTSASFSLNCTDADGDSLTCSVVDSPSKGDVTITDCDNVTYTPNANENGADSFTYIANDGTEDSATATANVTINAVNDAPVCAGAAVTTDEDTTSASFSLNCTDVEGDSLTCSVVTPPSKGAVNITNCGSVTYIPNLNENGADSFTYRANDSTDDSLTATGSVTINAVNDAPVIAPSVPDLTTPEDTVLNYDLTPHETDVDDTGTALHWSISGEDPALFTAAVNVNTDVLTITPVANACGSDAVTLTLTDSGPLTDTQDITVDVTCVNDAPVITPPVPDLITPKNTELDYALTPHETDVEDTGMALDWSISGEDPALFSASIKQNHTDVLTITPVADACGSDVVTLTLTDSGALTDTQDITVIVMCPNDPPVCTGASVTTDEDTASASFSLNCTDPDGDPLTCSVVDSPSKGTVTITDCDTVTYTPDPNENGPDSFTYRARDGILDSDTATANVTINAVNDPPVCTGAAVTTQEDTTSAPFSLNCTDVEGDSLTCSVVDSPSNGAVNITDCDTVTYTPNPGFSGGDSFTYSANDGIADSNTATVTITVSPAGGTIQVDIDIKPGSDPNSINLKSKGVIPVAILSGGGFDAETVDPLSVTFETAPPDHEHSGLKDVDHDGDLDLVMHFRTQLAQIASNATDACLSGETTGGQGIEGCDSIRIVPGTRDSDGDGFGDAVEATLCTQQFVRCGVGAWAVDFNDDGKLNLQDVNSFAYPVKHFGERGVWDHARWNIVDSPKVDLQDVNSLSTIAPPMFRNKRAWGNTMFGVAGTCPLD